MATRAPSELKTQPFTEVSDQSPSRTLSANMKPQLREALLSKTVKTVILSPFHSPGRVKRGTFVVEKMRNCNKTRYGTKHTFSAFSTPRIKFGIFI